ncbi:MAG: glycosyltransferase [bacterium]
MRVAIVHDYLNQFGGAERCVQALHEIFPEAPIFTSIYDEQRMPAGFRRMDIRTSFMQKIPFVFRFFKWYLLFYPLAFESFDLSEFDVIISSSSAWAKGVKRNPGQLHICYCYSPMRFVWRYQNYVERENYNPILKSILPLVLAPLKKWDLETNNNVDHFVAISKTIADRIDETYRLKSDIIFPPVETGKFSLSAVDSDYFLVVSRLNAYKRIDLVIEAFNELDLPLKIIGSGPELKRLKNLANANIEFLGRLPDKVIAEYYAECRALIFPGEEDFGIVPLEAMASGRPVIAFQAGGARETVVDGVTGMFFAPQTAQALVATVNKFMFKVFKKELIREHALTFSKEIFKAKMKDYVESKIRGSEK